MNRLIVGIKYCGHCNPTVEGPTVIEQIQKLDPELLFVSWAAPDMEVLLIFSGCATDCVTVPEYSGPEVHVAGYSLGQKQVLPEELPVVILNAIRNRRTRKEKSTERANMCSLNEY